MTHSLAKNKLAIIAGNPLVRLGMAQFIDGLHPGYHCVLSAPALPSLSEKCFTSLNVLLVGLDGAQDEQELMASQLRQLGEYYPWLSIVVYTASRDIPTLTALHVCRNISLIALQETSEQLRYDMAHALEGQQICSPCIKKSLKQQRVLLARPASNTLTKSERNVLTHLFAGLSLTDIAELCHRSIKTISAHKCNSMRKLGVHNDAELFQIPRSEVVLPGEHLPISTR